MEQHGKTDRALQFYQKALELQPDNVLANTKLASMFYTQNKITEAIICYTNALQTKPNDPHIHYNLGLCYLKQEAWEEATVHLRKTIALEPQHKRAHFNLAAIYEKLNKHESAISEYQNAVAIDPQSFEAYHHLGIAFRQLEKLEEAIDAYRKAVALQPKNIHLLMELANALNIANHNHEALEIYEKILEINPNVISALYNFGFTLKKIGNLERALDVYDHVLAKKADYAPARFRRSTICLALGDFEQGWQEYEWRWKAYSQDAKKFNLPLWEGEDLTNRTLLVFAEQGLGDTIQFVRYLQLLKEKYSPIQIILESQDPLVTLLEIQPYIDRVTSRHEQPPPCDYQIPLMSLPRIMQTTLETIPGNTPYIAAAPHLIEFWRKRLAADTNFKIGICWQGNAQYSTQSLRHAVAAKSIPLKLFAPLCDLEGVSVYSLQRIDGTEQISDCGFTDKLLVFDKTFDQLHGRFMDSAAVIKNLDLVISVDTGVCHLAGALNTQTWVLLPFPADWRWLQNYTDSPWYPTVRLFGQKDSEQWEPVMNRVVCEVQNLLTNKRENTPSTNKSNTTKQTPIYSKPTEQQQKFFEKLINTLG